MFLSTFTARAQEQARRKEGHAPRTRVAQRDADQDRESDRENPRERAAWFMRGRLYKGHPAPQLLVRAQQQRNQLRMRAVHVRELKAAQRAFGLANYGTTPAWSELGPSPLRSVTTAGDDQDYGWTTGRATAVAVDQTDLTGNTVYIGGAYGGVWKSTNAANPDASKVRWTPITDDQPTLAVGAIAIDPADSNIVLVGTGEANSSGDSYYGLGILRSTDGGNSWMLISEANNGLRPFHGLAFARIAFDSDNPAIVVAATAAAGVSVGGEDPPNDPAACANMSATATCRGLYYSYDAGQTWSQVQMMDPGGAPDNGSASDVVYNPQQRRFYAWSRAHGLYTSVDGVTFARAADQNTGSKGVVQPAAAINLANCPTSPVNLETCPVYRGQIAIVPGRDEMFVWFVDASSTPVDGGIYQTKDGGKTWVQLDTSGIEDCGDSLGCGTEQGDYNLALTAVPNGEATDVYAGAINIYRCQLTANNPTCSAKVFVNLTHVYGCTPTGSFSKVHPDQHAMDFLAANPNVIYFGNDGGIFRTLTSLYPMNIPLSCPETAPSETFFPFDNLNGTMGSMTQFVWFQQHPTDQFTMVGGTQDNGSPAIDANDSGSNGLTWRSVLAGDGGYTEINPENPGEWFTENTRVSIQRCAAGAQCTDSQFVPVISSATVGADDAAFYMPYMLDPQNVTQIILGTCRVWRVPSSGVNPPANALSQTFDGSFTCSSDSPSMVSSLAAGGAKNAQGSSVIYAGTADGQVYVTTNATTAQTNWTRASDSPGYVNWNGYPVSGVAIDPAVPAGTTAYVTVMGFKTGHVFQTTDAGASWTNITGDLPDAPADGVAIDGNTGKVYVATDVGVFSTTAVAGSSTQWSEVGPATGAGTLPNVAVTRIAIFHPQGQPPRLRASTYGRGIWEMALPGSTDPDYALAVSNPDLVTSPGSAVTFKGTEMVFNGYNKTVTLSCKEGTYGKVPGACSASAISGGAFTVTAKDSGVRDFSFRIEGTDGTLVRQVPVTLRVVDFTLGTAVPSGVSVVHGDSATVQLPLTSLGSFDKNVTVACDPKTLPAGMSCEVASVIVDPGGTSQVVVTFKTATDTAVGTYKPVIRATAVLDESHQILRTQTVAVTVTAESGFVLDTSGYSQQTLRVTEPLSASFSIQPRDGYAGTVSLTCAAPGSGIPSSACVLSLTAGGNAVSSVALSKGKAVAVYVKLDTSAGTAGSRQLEIMAADANQGMNSKATLPFSLTDFSLSGGGQSVDTTPGSVAKFTFSLTPLNGYKQTVKLSCDTSDVGVGVPCTLAPSQNVQLVAGQTATVTASVSVPTTVNKAGTYPVTVTATDATLATLHHTQSSSLQVAVGPDFTFGFGRPSISAKAGAPIPAIPVTVTAIGGFNATVTWSLAGCPELATCAVTPGSSSPGQTANLSISTTAPSVSSVRRTGSYLALSLGMPFAIGIVLVKRKRFGYNAVLLILLGLAGCGGGGGGGTAPPVTHPGTPAGTYTVVVTGTSGTVVHSQNFTLRVQ